MSKFTEFASIKPLVELDLWMTTNELEYYESNDLVWTKIIVPCGTITDWCSIPLCFLWQKVTPKTLPACILHDYLWSMEAWFWRSNWQLLKWLKATDQSVYTRWKIYLWVTIFWYPIYFFKKRKNGNN